MKRISIVCLTGLLFLTACENTGSSTVGSWEKEETTQSTEKTEGASHEEQAKEKTDSVTVDTLKAGTDGTQNKANTGAAMDTTRQ